MTTPLRLALVLHNHQPVGNFDDVCEHSYQTAYEPFLAVFKQYPSLRVTLHTSGPLLEWLDEHHPDYLDEIGELAHDGRIELLGGPRYEPVLPGIPRVDRVGQVRSAAEWHAERFGLTPQGVWLPERVWEQSLVGDLTRAGVRYTLLDDYHFQQSAVPDDQLHGYHLTEDEGRLLKVFPICERLRYAIPFEEPYHAIEHLRWVHGCHGGTVVTFGDDGEKFGSWPGTAEHVYTNRWLHRFFDLLLENADWLTTVTLGEAASTTDPVTTTYLADNSYREMTDWSLPPLRQNELKEIVSRKDGTHDADWWRLRPSIRRGFWRNFRVRYPEVGEMYARMVEVSARVQRVGQELASRDADDSRHTDATLALYKAQCNCPYWHGAFGGLYLPHLRDAVYGHLIEADRLLDCIEEQDGDDFVDVRDFDQNLDGKSEVLLRSGRLRVYVAPSRGGSIYELDVLRTGHNLLATLDRRPEAYHDDVRESAHQGVSDPDALADKPHEAVRFKSAGLDGKLFNDEWPRKSLVDHVLAPRTTREEFMRNLGHAASAHHAEYTAQTYRTPDSVAVTLSTKVTAHGSDVGITKSVGLGLGKPGELEIHYRLENLPQPATSSVPSLRLAIEFQFAGIAAGAPDRYLFGGEGEVLGPIGTELTTPPQDRFGLVDEWRGEEVELSLSEPASFWCFPIETISNSEGGFEAVHQSCCVVPVFDVTPDAQGSWSTTLRLSIDTSAKDARRLGERAAVRIAEQQEVVSDS